MGFASAIQTASGRLGIMRELFGFFWTNKRWWLVPMLIILFVVGILIILAQSSAIAPFIYPLF